MKVQENFRIVKTRERIPTTRYSDTAGLITAVISKGCYTLEPGEYMSIGEADAMRSLKDFPDDYLIIQVW